MAAGVERCGQCNDSWLAGDRVCAGCGRPIGVGLGAVSRAQLELARPQRLAQDWLHGEGLVFLGGCPECRDHWLLGDPGCSDCGRLFVRVGHQVRPAGSLLRDVLRPVVPWLGIPLVLGIMATIGAYATFVLERVDRGSSGPAAMVAGLGDVAGSPGGWWVVGGMVILPLLIAGWVGVTNGNKQA